ncbi:MAG: bleomycin resistance protein [Alphaproteobacteria bacterium]|nr:MAG: bleomycin resistance protein [Alphaproteobacteria bacterium]
MVDHATPNLPARDFEATAQFYGRLGFGESWRDAGWMILHRGELTVEFFPYPDLDPATSSFSCCFRMDDVDGFFEVIVAAGVPVQTTGWPRAHRPKREPWGGLVGALIDPDGTLVRLVQEHG